MGSGHGEAVDEEEEAAGDGHGTGKVVAAPRLAAALTDDPAGRHGGDGGDRHVDEQGPPPRGQLGQGPTENQADGRSPTGDGAIHAEGAGTLPGLGEGDGQNRQGGRGHDGGESTLKGPGAEKHGLVLRQSAEGGSGAETEEAHDEHPTTAQVVGDAAPQQQQAPEGQGVRAHHPLAIGHRDVQGPLSRRQGHDDDRGVQDDHELGQGDHGQGPVALRVGPRVLGAEHGGRIGHGHGGCLRESVGLSWNPLHPCEPTLAFWSGSIYNRSVDSVYGITIRSVRSVCQHRSWGRSS